MKDTPHFPCFMNNSSASPSTPKIIGFFNARFSKIFDGIAPLNKSKRFNGMIVAFVSYGAGALIGKII